MLGSLLVAALLHTWSAAGLLAQNKRLGNALSRGRVLSSESSDAAVMKSFEELAMLETRCARIDKQAGFMLERFYDPDLKSFALEAGATRNYSVTSTALSTLAGLDSVACSRQMRVTLDGVIEKLLEAKWRDEDLLQLPLVLCAVFRLGAEGGPAERAALSKCDRLGVSVDALLNARPRLRDWRRQRYSSYVQYWTLEAMLSLIDERHDTTEGAFELVEMVGTDREALAFAMTRSYEVARDELCRQIAYHASKDRTSFDVTKLVCSLASYAAVAKNRARIAELHSVEKEEDDEISLNTKLVKAGLLAFFDEQQQDGLWAPGQAVFARSRRQFEVGNAYAFAPDLVAILARLLVEEDLEPYCPRLLRLTEWIEAHDQNGRGWRSNHLRTGPPLAWSTAQTLSCASSLLRVSRSLLNDQVLREFGGRKPDKVRDGRPWASLLDSDLLEGRSLKSVIEERIIQPRLSQTVAASCAAPMAHSVVLFGPPGTAKTTTCEYVARALGFGFVVVDTAVFLADGLQNVASRIAHVFERLRKLQNCVILFDEIEEFALDRKTPAIGMESRMLTTAMLTQINELRRAERSIFFIATNRLQAFDSAITRPGRIDLQLFIGTPTLLSRVGRFKAALLPATDEIVETFSEFLKANWAEDVVFLNYLESERFKAASVELVRQDNFSKATLTNLLNQQLEISILRDATARDEYTSSMRLTRI